MQHQPHLLNEMERMARQIKDRQRACMVLAAAQASAQLQAKVRRENLAYDHQRQERVK